MREFFRYLKELEEKVNNYLNRFIRSCSRAIADTLSHLFSYFSDQSNQSTSNTDDADDTDSIETQEVVFTKSDLNQYLRDNNLTRETLKSFVIPNECTEIGDETFKECSMLKSITLHNGLKKIGKQAFSGCTQLESIAVPDSVTVIKQSAFNDCTNLRWAVLSNNITKLDGGMFNLCKKLTRVHLPDGIKKIGFMAFRDCHSLRHIDIPDSVEIIENHALDHNGLEIVYLPENLKLLKERAFMACENLQYIIRKNTNIDLKSDFDRFSWDAILCTPMRQYNEKNDEEYNDRSIFSYLYQLVFPVKDDISYKDECSENGVQVISGKTLCKKLGILNTPKVVQKADIFREKSDPKIDRDGIIEIDRETANLIYDAEKSVRNKAFESMTYQQRAALYARLDQEDSESETSNSKDTSHKQTASHKLLEAPGEERSLSRQQDSAEPGSVTMKVKPRTTSIQGANKSRSSRP